MTAMVSTSGLKCKLSAEGELAADLSVREHDVWMNAGDVGR